MREEAIMLLRRFYIQENQKGELFQSSVNSWLNVFQAPEPKVKKGRELNTEILPPPMDTQIGESRT